MYSQCPECHARFRVTAAALKAANGTVRCGRCGAAFNALATLSDTLPAPAVVDTSPLETPAELVMPTTPQGGEPVQASGSSDATPDGAGQPVLVSESAPSEDITLEGERIRIESLSDLDLDLAAKEIGGDLDLDLALAAKEIDGDLDLDLAEKETGGDLDLDLALAAKEIGGDLDLDLAAKEAGGDLDLNLAAKEAGDEIDLDVAAREAGRDLDLNFDVEQIGSDLDLNFEAEELVHDLDSTDEFKIIDDVPDSAWPVDEPAPSTTASTFASQGGGAAVAESEAPAQAAAAPAAPVRPVATPAQRAAVPESEHPSLHVLLETPAARTAPARVPPAAGERPGTRSTGTITAGTPADLRWHRRQATDEVAEPAPSRGRAVAWALGSLVLALALLAQVAHQYRQQLVRHPQVGPLLRAAYDSLGLPLSPNWDVGAFELRQWGNDELPGATGRLTVRASLTNRASFAQPHPLLRLEFDDRYGEALASRDFQPSEYLRNSEDASRLLAPGASADVELVIVDPGKDAVGYQLDACLPESSKVLRCTRGPG